MNENHSNAVDLSQTVSAKHPNIHRVGMANAVVYTYAVTSTMVLEGYDPTDFDMLDAIEEMILAGVNFMNLTDRDEWDIVEAIIMQNAHPHL
ncbi:hypothetical protein Toil_gp03 [Rhodococcus phage Toil]|uniref:Uncharacterized protein n=1 Tax=Rhodococcus phage Toil TaxID=1975614 RepID=A0A1W6DXV3_9VIRU|nr:hypothetical protein KMD62_gp03 [Rhodococcus phage Toil]ARK07686.1 hypothetical protein Toil_gp03 [Rhodococcus phage Toil]